MSICEFRYPAPLSSVRVSSPASAWRAGGSGVVSSDALGQLEKKIELAVILYRFSDRRICLFNQGSLSPNVYVSALAGGRVADRDKRPKGEPRRVEVLLVRTW